MAGRIVAGGQRKPVYNALQGLRGVAALLVMADHLLLTAVRRLGCPPAAQSYAYLLGDTGIQIFFAISGFVMILAHGDDFGQPNAPGAFMSRRVCRIVPLYWIVTLFYWGKERMARHFIPAWLLIPSLLFIPHQEADVPFGRPVFAIGWTLEFEMMFYLVFALALFLPRAGGLALVTLAFLTSCLAAATGLTADHPVLAFYGDPIVLFFIGGVWLGMLQRHLRHVERSWGFGPALFGALALIAGEMAVAAIWTPSAVRTSPLGAIICIATVLLCTMARESRDGGVVKAAARTLGDATYSIYLTHTFVLGMISSIMARHGYGTVALFAATLPVVILLGVLVYRFVERPLVRAAARLSERLFGERVRRPAPAVSNAVGRKVSSAAQAG